MSTFEVVRGPEGDCLLLDDTRISGPKPWGGGAVTKTFHTDETYAVVPKDELDRLKAENAKLRELVRDMWLHSYCSIAKTREDDDRHIEDVIDRMRELGVDA